MTFETIERPRPKAAQPFYATPPNAIRLTSFRQRNSRPDSWLVRIWLGGDLAAKAGFVDHRHMVDLLLDQTDGLRIGIQLNPTGQYRVSRWGLGYCVHLDSITSARLFNPFGCLRHIAPENIEASPGMIVFKVLPSASPIFEPAR